MQMASPLPISKNGRRYGFLRRPRSHREFGITSVPNLSPLPPPPIDMHLGIFMQAVKDQGDLGACTAFTGAADREAIAAQFQLRRVTLSPRFLYYEERKLNGTLDQGDCGSDGQTSCQVLQSVGICLEEADPYDVKKFDVPPTDDMVASAANFKAGAYHSIFALDDVKTCINSGYRMRVGMSVYESFEDTGSNGLVPVPNTKREALLGGHEVLAWGYDDTISVPGAQGPGAVRFRNSWGTSWGLGGDFWLAYELMTPGSVIDVDIKIQHLGPAWR